MIVAEPDFTTEKQLEDAIASVAEAWVHEAGRSGVVLRGFGLDIAVFASVGAAPVTRLFEVKAFSSHNGRCGFGNQGGEGNQIRLLFDHARGEPRLSQQLKLFDDSIRWILGDTSKPHGSSRYVMFTCQQAQAVAAAGVRPGKQNNLRISGFKENWINWPELVARQHSFLLSGAGQ